MMHFANAQKSVRRPVNVLLVEDDDIDARIIKLVAELVEGFNLGLTRVDSLTGAKAALDKAALEGARFDICLLDFWLGRESSLRFLAALEQMDSLLGTVVLSNISQQDATKLRLSSGRNYFLPKADCTPQQLEQAIGAVIALQPSAPDCVIHDNAA